ncbi:MAG: penicillin acylase family protein, partial [Longimicrobiales bacterium]|nr:penicillin acylase family protein [Longimicrobiales bacterium]
YGVNMPSVPRILIGFNRDVAWSFTNTGADVLDYYEEEVDDPEDPVRYRVDGVWRPLDTRIEEIRGPDGEVLAVDTLYMTHRGPMIENEGRFLSMAWTVLGAGSGGAGPAGGEDRALRAIMEAESVEEWMEAMASYQAPAQNGIVADRSGTIAIRSTGLFPLHPDADGRDVEDGSTTAPEWNGFWPIEDYPQSISPTQGYLASANQEPLAPGAYPAARGASDEAGMEGASSSGVGDAAGAYLGASWTSPWRALRINELLRADSAVTPEAMGRYHLDPGNPRADHFVPAFLDAVERSASATGPDGEGEENGGGSPAGGAGSRVDSQLLREAAGLLAEWDRRYTLANERAVLFEYAMEALVDRTWDELEPPAGPGSDSSNDSGGSGPPDRVATPSEAILLGLLDDPDSPWWDHRSTPDVVEHADDVLRASLVEGYERAVELHGPPEDGGWQWEEAWAMDIWHMLNLPSLSELRVPTRGGDGTLNPLYSRRGTSGASWRMVVEMGPQVRGWTIYPGGQSGNPVSPWYADRVGAWSRGELEPALFPRSESELDADRVAATLELVPGP